MASESWRYKMLSHLWLWSLSGVFIASITSMIGVIILYFGFKGISRSVFFLISLAVGAMFGDAFIHLIPEIYREAKNTAVVSAGFLTGILIFFILDKVLRTHHHHRTGETDDRHVIGPLNMIADATHNFIDGTLIAASFLASYKIGVATTAAVLLHEIPHEIGDYGVLIHAGYSRLQAMLFNFLTALLAFAGAIITLSLGSSVTQFTAWILPVATGGFIYIAGADLVPELHKDLRPQSIVQQFAAIVIGIAVMFALLLLE
jgi:zinc and cadmium transporter